MKNSVGFAGLALVALSLAAGCSAAPAGDDGDVSTGAATTGAKDSDWVGLYGTESTQFIMALNVTSEEPLVFALSASRQNLNGITVDAHDLQAKYDDASKTTATFTRGDCTLKLAQTDSGIDVTQEGACTSIGVPTDMVQIDGSSLSSFDDVCWDSDEKSFKVPGSCKASAGF